MKNVLVTPLDWGLGHASRCIPIIRNLLDRKCSVFIAGSGDSLELLKREFPSLTFFSLPSYRPVYSTSSTLIWKMASQLPKFLLTIRSEHKRIQEIISSHQIHFIISDHRYGCWSSAIPSAFITHQINILMPKRFRWLGRLVRKINIGLIKKFSVCWIPDYADGRRLAGKLTLMGKFTSSSRVKYLGTLSRFAPSTAQSQVYDVVCILSGPEPQRSLFENMAVEQLSRSGLKYFVVRGLPVSSENALGAQVEHANFLKSDELQHIIERSHCVLARSGYSTVMDLARLGKKAIFVPTPGQTEQEYLAARLKGKGIAFFMEQDKLDLEYAWKVLESYSGFNLFPEDAHQLTDVLDKFLSIETKLEGEVSTL